MTLKNKFKNSLEKEAESLTGAIGIQDRAEKLSGRRMTLHEAIECLSTETIQIMKSQKKFLVQIVERVFSEVEVEAKNEEIAREMICNGYHETPLEMRRDFIDIEQVIEK